MFLSTIVSKKSWNIWLFGKNDVLLHSLNETLSLNAWRQADMAQLVEQRIRNAWVPGSSPGIGSIEKLPHYNLKRN